MTDFKVGDLVKVKIEEFETIGKITKIDHENSWLYPYTVNNNIFKFSELTLIEGKQEYKMSEFKIGDKVRCYDGNIGIIVEIDDFDSLYRINNTWYCRRDISLIEEIQEKINWICTNSGQLSIIIGDKSYSIPKDHLNYKKIKEALQNNDSKLIHELANPTQTLMDYTAPIGNIKIKNGQVYRNGELLHNVITTKILGLHRDGFPIDPMVKFLDNLMANPSKRAVEELYPFLERRGMPITEDGCFLGYKRVRENWMDWYSNKIDNSIGKIIEMERNLVSDNWMEKCDAGYHVGCIEYCRNFHQGSRMIIVKVNPKDVVSVPPCETTKLRTCRYEVLKEYDRDLLKELDKSLYTSDGYEYEDNEF